MIETLINFKEGGRNNAAFLGKERFYWIRIIQRYNCLTRIHQDDWKRVISNTPVETIKELAFAVHQFQMQCACWGACTRKKRCRKPLTTLLTPFNFFSKIRKTMAPFVYWCCLWYCKSLQPYHTKNWC